MNEQLQILVTDLIEVLNKHYPHYDLANPQELVMILLIHNDITKLNALGLNYLYPNRPRKEPRLLTMGDFET